MIGSHGIKELWALVVRSIVVICRSTKVCRVTVSSVDNRELSWLGQTEPR